MGSKTFLTGYNARTSRRSGTTFFAFAKGLPAFGRDYAVSPAGGTAQRSSILPTRQTASAIAQVRMNNPTIA